MLLVGGSLLLEVGSSQASVSQGSPGAHLWKSDAQSLRNKYMDEQALNNTFVTPFSNLVFPSSVLNV